jgi:phosphoribosylglycinamide formyltransferase-1
MIKNIAIFASGVGTNALNIIRTFEKSDEINIKLLICNKSDAPILDSVKKYNIETLIISNEKTNDSKFLIENCNWFNINLIVLAGFLRKLPKEFIEYFPNQIINIHPSLLPKYGGQGMWGDNVHKKVIENKEKESGITIHYVDTEYDSGEIIAQFKCDLKEETTFKDLKSKISELEMMYYPYVIETILI